MDWGVLFVTHLSSLLYSLWRRQLFSIWPWLFLHTHLCKSVKGGCDHLSCDERARVLIIEGGSKIKEVGEREKRSNINVWRDFERHRETPLFLCWSCVEKRSKRRKNLHNVLYFCHLILLSHIDFLCKRTGEKELVDDKKMRVDERQEWEKEERRMREDGRRPTPSDTN